MSQVNPSPQAIQPSANIPPAQVALHTRNRDEKLRLEMFEFAYDASVRHLHRLQVLIDASGVLLAIWVLFVQVVMLTYDVPEGVQTAFALVSSGLALLAISCTIWGFIANWRGQLEKQSSLARRLHLLISEIEEALRNQEVDERKSRKWAKERTAIDADRKDPLAQLHRRFLHAGHQHVAKKYPALELECTVCRRKWKPEYARQRYFPWHRWSICEGCGVKNDKPPSNQSSVSHP